MFETVVTLKPPDQWREGMDRERLVSEMHEALEHDVAGVLKPVALAGLTAIAGFGSLGFANNPTLSGLGLACAEELARAGYAVLLASRDPALGEAAAARLRAEGLAVEARQLDVGEAASIAKLAQRLAADRRSISRRVMPSNAGPKRRSRI
jgi:uncharacterized membrane protein YdfJ with MMPL/SSD domain